MFINVFFLQDIIKIDWMLKVRYVKKFNIV